MVGEDAGESASSEDERVGRRRLLQHELGTLEEGHIELGRGLDEDLQSAPGLLSLVRARAGIELLAQGLERGQVACIHDAVPSKVQDL